MDLESLRQPAALATVAALMLAAGLAGAWVARRLPKGSRAADAPAAPVSLDPVTGLPSRESFEEQVDRMFARAEGEGRGVCLLYAGLDGFRPVNERAGQAVGDKVLRAAAQRLASLCGASTPLCRVLGDEFAICVDAPLASAEQFARRIVESFAVPLRVDAQEFALGLSVGIAVSPDHGDSPRLVRRAAAAMRAVKRSGGAAHAIFDPRIEAEQRDELHIARELQHAVARGEVELLYQPCVEAGSLEVTTVEALMRWKHPALGMVSPAKFIPIAERHGLIEALGQWVLETALAQTAEWLSQGLCVRMALNVSGHQLRQESFAARLQAGLQAHRVPAELVTCEIDVAATHEDPSVARQSFGRLAQLGVRLAVSRVGVGPTNMATLAALGVAEVKIARPLSSAVVDQYDAHAAVTQLLSEARAHQLRVIAEGVETDAQRDALVQLGVHELQGYLLAKPMTARAVAVWASDAPNTLVRALNPMAFRDTEMLSERGTQIPPL
ncbi:MAG TPA: bifunctional diguanylate cyclase/phosphodiesterase [Burkholderiaceae bacterium]|nr:bifunctional diguanylate cyclase/phosphodiesterase [Burkholderiaceae bacterium]